MLKKSVIAAIVVCGVLCLSAETLLAGEKCKEVVIGKTMIGPFQSGPENCDGYDGCATSKISGTFSGTVTESWYDGDFYFVVDDTWAFTNYGVFETTQGEVFFRERSIGDFEAPDGFAVHTLAPSCLSLHWTHPPAGQSTRPASPWPGACDPGKDAHIAGSS